MKKAPSKAVIRRRNNARIKKLVAPKAPVQVLNELVGPGNVKFSVHAPEPGMMAINSQRLLLAEVVVEGQTFTGSGPSKAIAKNIAAEAAVHYVVMQRNKEEPPEDGGRFQDTTPWGALASLGRYWCDYHCLMTASQLCSNCSMTGSPAGTACPRSCAPRRWRGRA